MFFTTLVCNSLVKDEANSPCDRRKALEVLLVESENTSMKKLWSLFIATCLCLAATNVFGQDVLTKGMIGGTVTDPAGAADHAFC